MGGDRLPFVAFDDAATSLMHKADLRKTDVANELKGLRGRLKKAKLKGFARGMREKLTGREVGFEGALVELKEEGSEPVLLLRAEKVMSKRELAVFKSVAKFVSTELDEVLTIVREELSGYDVKVEMWGEVPVVRAKKEVQGVLFEVGVRAPVGEEAYGRAFRVWVRANGVHLFPVEPVRYMVFGRECTAYVWRVFHTKGWQERLRKLLRWWKEHEDWAWGIVNRFKDMPAPVALGLLAELDVPEVAKEEIRRNPPKTLWELAERLARFDPQAGLQAIEMAVKEYTGYELKAWLHVETAEVVPAAGEELYGPVLAPVERAAVVDEVEN